MWRLILNLLFVAICSVSSKQPRIIGGSETQLGEFPYMVGLLEDNMIFCGGSLYHSRHVLTAAHCVHDNPKDLVVMVGDIYANDKGTPSRSKLLVSKIIVHPQFNLKRVLNDIAILVLTKAITEGSNVGIIPLNTDPVFENMQCNMAGWGAHARFDQSRSPILLKAQVKVLADKECRKAYQLYNSSCMICAGVKGDEIEACPGDSGGPLVCNNKMTGIVSYGDGCEGSNLPTIYTNIAALQDWIKVNSIGLKTGIKGHSARNSTAHRFNKYILPDDIFHLQNPNWIGLTEKPTKHKRFFDILGQNNIFFTLHSSDEDIMYIR